ncbi:MAG: secretin N-terminal domain-containing protein [Candidatus Omnitrophota bacterium]
MMSHYFFRLRMQVAFTAVFCGALVFTSLSSAADFDFYNSDLISRESYRKISMDFKDANLKNVLKVFSEQAGLNFIAAQSVQDRPVTLYLNEVPLQDALKKIMEANNLKYELEPGGNIFLVKDSGKPVLELVTKIYNLRFARLKDSPLDKAIERGLEDPLTQLSGSAGSSAGSASRPGGIEETVKNVLSGNGKLVVDTRTNSLIVTDVAPQFEVIDQVIALLDVPAYQIMIEVEMLDVNKETLDQLGVLMSETMMELTGASRGTRFPFHTIGMANPPSAAPSFSYGSLSAAGFSATLELLKTDTDTKFLARPRILSTANETAEIRIATNEVIGVKVTFDDAGNISSEEAERAITGIILKVTPQVDIQNGMITMFVQPSVSETKESSITIAGITQRDPEVRTSATTLTVKSGDTIVVGGLIRNKETTVRTSVPFLGDLPLIGAFFRHKNKEIKERELLVFLTPRIVGYEEKPKLADFATVTGTSLKMPAREQSVPVLRRDEIDMMMQKWEH